MCIEPIVCTHTLNGILLHIHTHTHTHTQGSGDCGVSSGVLKSAEMAGWIPRYLICNSLSLKQNSPSD